MQQTTIASNVLNNDVSFYIGCEYSIQTWCELMPWGVWVHSRHRWILFACDPHRWIRPGRHRPPRLPPPPLPPLPRHRRSRSSPPRLLPPHVDPIIEYVECKTLSIIN